MAKRNNTFAAQMIAAIDALKVADRAEASGMNKMAQDIRSTAGDLCDAVFSAAMDDLNARPHTVRPGG